MASITHATVATGTNNPDKQVSVTAWNADHVVSGVTSAVATRSAMAALATDDPAYLNEEGREGTFVFYDDDLSAKVAADTEQGIYVAPASDATGASGAWVRQGKVLTPRMFGGVESVKTGNRLTGSPAYSETLTDATDAVQALFDMVRAEDDKAWDADLTGFWGLSDPDSDGYCIIIDQPYWLVREFKMGHFAVMAGETGTAVFKIEDAAYNHRTTGRWEIWGGADGVADAYSGRTFMHGIEIRSGALWDIESIYCRGFKKWGVYLPGLPVDAVYNQNIGLKIGRLKANYCGSVPSNATARVSSTYSDGTYAGGSNSDAQRSVIVLSQPVGDFAANDWVVINDEPYEVMAVDSGANSLSIFPWLPSGEEVSGTLYGLYGGGLSVRGSDTATVKIEFLDTIGCGFGHYSAGLYGMSVHCSMAQSGGAAMGLGTDGGNTLGNSVLQTHWEGNQFDLITRNADGTQAFICGVQSIAGDDIGNPFKNCRSLGANDGTALNQTISFPNVTFNVGGVDYHSKSGQSKSRAYIAELSNDPRNNQIRKVADSLSVSLKYYEPVDRFFRDSFVATLEVVGTAGGAPSGSITVTPNATDVSGGITLDGAGDPVVFSGLAGPLRVEFWLDTNGATKNWIVVEL